MSLFKRASKHHDKHLENQTLEQLNGRLPGYAYRPQGSSAPAEEEDRTEKRLRRRSRIKKTVVSILLLLLLVGSWPAYKFISNQIKVFGVGGLASFFNTTKLKGEDRGYVNILLAGNSSDDPGHAGASLTDSIMLVSLNTKTNTAFMMSVPRDLYVDIPGFDYAKINEAYQDGESTNFSEGGYATGGMGLLAKTVSESFGIPVDYYALVDYSAVRQAVDAVGGISVTIASDDARGVYDPSPDLANDYKALVKLANGKQSLNGVQALGLARARGNAYGSYGFASSDFARTEHQRLILLGLKDQATASSTFTNPIKLGKLADSFGDNVKTDLTLGEVRRLYDLSKKIPSDKIASVGLNDVDGKNLLASYRTRTGQSALVPAAGVDDFSAIQAYLQTLLNPPAPATDDSTTAQ
jgi:polyisoprenyl-teichoic acid--peptidoglycan teichoic acid transferase